MAGPAGRVTAVTSTGLTVTIDSITGLSGGSLKLQTRALGGAANWDDRATDATPAVGDTLTTAALTAGTAYEWRVIETAGTTIDDGTHGVVTPASSIWATILSEVKTSLEGSGITTAYEGTAPPPNPTPIMALMRTLPEITRREGNNIAEVEYPVEVELRLVETSDTGEQRTQDIATYQRVIVSNFDAKTSADFPSITGLFGISVELRSKDESGPDDFADETRGRAVIRFRIWEAR